VIDIVLSTCSLYFMFDDSSLWRGLVFIFSCGRPLVNSLHYVNWGVRFCGTLLFSLNLASWAIHQGRLLVLYQAYFSFFHTGDHNGTLLSSVWRPSLLSASIHCFLTTSFFNAFAERCLAKEECLPVWI
jgi:hypothetical protein